MKNNLKKQNFNVYDSGFAFALAYGVMALMQIICVEAFRGNSNDFGGIAIANWVILALNQVAILIALVGYSFARKTNFLHATKLNVAPNWKQVLLIPFISLACILAFLPLSEMFSALLQLMGFENPMQVATSSNLGVYFLNLFVVALLPAISEELLMRGVVVSGFRERTPAFAILVSSLIFSLMHQNPAQTIHQFLFGIVLCLVFLFSESIYIPMLLHFFNNFIAITVSTFATSSLLVGLGNMIWLVYVAMLIVGLFVLSFLLYCFFLFSPKRKEADKLVVQSQTEEFSFKIVEEEKPKTKIGIAKSDFHFFRFFAGMFTGSTWKKLKYILTDERTGVSKSPKDCFTVWLVVAVLAIMWIVALVKGI